MTRKRRHRERLATLKARAWQERLRTSSPGIVVDRNALAPYNSYSTPDFIERGTYLDLPFVCDRCGESYVWTAEWQKWWYEVAKGIPLSTATRCQGCRRRERERNQPNLSGVFELNPFKRPKPLLIGIDVEIKSKLFDCGFRPACGIMRGGRHLYYLDYGRADDMLTVSWHRHDGRLAAELLTEEGAGIRVIAEIIIRRHQGPPEIETRLAEFLATVRSFLDGLQPDPEGRPMANESFPLPDGLPVPIDDGAADHLSGAHLPELSLPATTGDSIRLSDLDKAVVFAYPRTGSPGHHPGPDWDAIPGARGCTPQGCAFRDLAGDFNTLGVRVFGLSTQTTEYQREFADRNHLPFPILSDASLELVRALNLPTFEFDIAAMGGGGPSTLIRRMTWFVEAGTIRKVWYPVFPPDRNAGIVLDWLRSRGRA